MPRRKFSFSDEQKIDYNALNELLSTLISEQLKSLKEKHAMQFSKRERKRKREPRIGFNLLIPHKLYARLRHYIDFCADKGESMTSIILAGLEKELQERFQKKLAQRGITE